MEDELPIKLGPVSNGEFLPVPAEGLTAEDLVTNEFIDPSIGLPADLAAAGTEADGSGAAETEVAETAPAPTGA